MPRLLMTTLISVALFVQIAPASADRANAREYVRLGALSAEHGHVDEALRRYQQAIASDPDYAEPYELALPLWIRNGQEGEATRQLELLTLRCPTCAFAWYALGALYRRGLRFDLAVLAYEAYLGRRPMDPDGLFGLGMALVAQGEDRAWRVLERYVALEQRPERDPYRREALRLLRDRYLHTRELSPALRKLLGYLEPLRPWINILWRRTSAGGAGRGSSLETRPR